MSLLEGLLPHLQQFVRVRQALVGAAALGASAAGLLDNTQIGVIDLDRRARILPADHVRFERLLAGAMPVTGGERLVVRADGVIRVPDLCGTCKVVPMERCHG